jgi:hypothetical protein
VVDTAEITVAGGRVAGERLAKRHKSQVSRALKASVARKAEFFPRDAGADITGYSGNGEMGSQCSQ